MVFICFSKQASGPYHDDPLLKIPPPSFVQHPVHLISTPIVVD